MDGSRLKPIVWIGSSLDDVRDFPDGVRQAVGFALYAAQRGGKSTAAKPLRGIVTGAGVLEIVEDHDTDTYRAVYTVRLGSSIYVLHAFQKKSRKGRQLAKKDLRLIKQRYAAAQAHSEVRGELR